MRPSDYLLNPQKLEDLVGYSLTLILSLAVFFSWTLVRGKAKVLVREK